MGVVSMEPENVEYHDEDITCFRSIDRVLCGGS